MGEAVSAAFWYRVSPCTTTEVGDIAVPILRRNPGLKNFLALILLAGTPAIGGVGFGGLSFDPVLATAFMAVGVGAILQLIWEVGKIVVRDTARLGRSLINWVNLRGGEWRPCHQCISRPLW